LIPGPTTIVGPGINQPDPYPGYGGFVGWVSPIRLRNGDWLVSFSAGYWHASAPTPLRFSPGNIAEYRKIGLPADAVAPRGGRAMIMRSTDEGKTWSKPVAVDPTAQDLTSLLSTVSPAEVARRVASVTSAALLSTVSPAEVARRVASVTSVGTGHPLTALPFLVAAAEPLPCRLSTQQLVELLKYPSCVGTARRVVLDYLGHRYQRRFADLWKFVDYAHEHLPGLDLTTPPKRPPR
jgi:hypothetical protein